jgi:hypothetical protein
MGCRGQGCRTQSHRGCFGLMQALANTEAHSIFVFPSCHLSSSAGTSATMVPSDEVLTSAKHMLVPCSLNGTKL